MSKATKKEDKPRVNDDGEELISVYNDTDGIIGCMLTVEGLQGERRPYKNFRLLPGNNPDVLKKEWDLAMQNEVFAGHTKMRKVKNGVGRLQKKRQLIVGKFDEDQIEEERKYDERKQAAMAEKDALERA